MTETQNADSTNEGRVKLRCPKCGGDRVVASTWCWLCMVRRNDWVKVEPTDA